MTEQLLVSATDALGSYGALIVGLLLAAIIYLARQCEARQKRIDQMHDERVKDGNDFAVKTYEATRMLTEMYASLERKSR